MRIWKIKTDLDEAKWWFLIGKMMNQNDEL